MKHIYSIFAGITIIGILYVTVFYKTVEVEGLKTSQEDCKPLHLSVHNKTPHQSCWHTNNFPLATNVSKFLVGCILFKNEARYLKEWLVYHQLAGFDYMYMYDDQSVDSPLPVLKPFIERGFVTYHPWGGKPGRLQTEQMRHCWNHYSASSEWLSYFDLDEFYVPYFKNPENETTGFISRMLYEFYMKTAGVEVHRADYDCSGHVSPPDQLVMEGFLSRWVSGNTAGKVFLHNRYTQSYSGHQAVAQNGYKMVDARMGDVNNDRKFIEFPLRMNHYVTRSYAECVSKGNQSAFPGGWRAVDPVGFCGKGMVGTPQYEPLYHFVDDYLNVHYGPMVKDCMAKI